MFLLPPRPRSLKLPNYSSREIVKERVLFAIKEGQGGFHLVSLTISVHDSHQELIRSIVSELSLLLLCAF